MQFKIFARKIDGRLRQVDPGHARATLRETHQVGADPASDFEQFPVLERREVHQLRQVMQLVEAIVVEVVEKRFAADRLAGHFEIVNAMVPVIPDGVDHKSHIVQCALQRCSGISAEWRTRNSTSWWSAPVFTAWPRRGTRPSADCRWRSSTRMISAPRPPSTT